MLSDKARPFALIDALLCTSASPGSHAPVSPPSSVRGDHSRGDPEPSTRLLRRLLPRGCRGRPDWDAYSVCAWYISRHILSLLPSGHHLLSARPNSHPLQPPTAIFPSCAPLHTTHLHDHWHPKTNPRHTTKRFTMLGSTSRQSNGVSSKAARRIARDERRRLRSTKNLPSPPPKKGGRRRREDDDEDKENIPPMGCRYPSPPSMVV